ncbi:50S ribosomal protein L4 [bacterium]|nr:50S ribosomal protein L4 [bacterium]
MPNAKLYDNTGNQIGEESLADCAFGAKINEAVVHQYVKTYLANQRQGNACAKTRGDVRGGGRKPWRQKGTGRARAGSITSPLWRHGGVTFGPKPRNFTTKTPKKMKKIAFSSVLSSRAENDHVIVLNDIKFEAPKTKEVMNLLLNIQIPNDMKVLFITREPHNALCKAIANIPLVNVEFVGEVSAYDVLYADYIVIQKDALPLIEERCL